MIVLSVAHILFAPGQHYHTGLSANQSTVFSPLHQSQLSIVPPYQQESWLKFWKQSTNNQDFYCVLPIEIIFSNVFPHGAANQVKYLKISLFDIIPIIYISFEKVTTTIDRTTGIAFSINFGYSLHYSKSLKKAFCLKKFFQPPFLPVFSNIPMLH